MDAVAHDTLVLHEKSPRRWRSSSTGWRRASMAMVRHVEQGWTAALEQQVQHQDATVTHLREALDAHAQGVEQRSTALLAGVGEAHAAPGRTAARDEQRMAQLATAVETMAATCSANGRLPAPRPAQQQQICRTLEDTARTMAIHAETHATRTIDEIARLDADGRRGAASPPR